MNIESILNVVSVLLPFFLFGLTSLFFYLIQERESINNSFRKAAWWLFSLVWIGISVGSAILGVSILVYTGFSASFYTFLLLLVVGFVGFVQSLVQFSIARDLKAEHILVTS